MKRASSTIWMGILSGSLLAGAAPAVAGGLYIPGNGPISTMRAGASVASASGADAVAANPAGMTKVRGTVVSVGSNLIDYELTFKRRGVYDDAPAGADPLPWAGATYAGVEDASTPRIGLGEFQAIPLIAVSSDLGGAVRGLRVGAGLVLPNAYPSREFGADYVLDESAGPPPPTRYDIVEQEAAVLLPSVAVAYRVNEKLDLGARFSFGNAHLKARVYLWGLPENYQEWTGHDAEFTVDTKDNFVPAFSAGALYRPLEDLELGVHWTSPATAKTKGTGVSKTSEFVTIGGAPATIGPLADGDVNCAPGGTIEALSACVELQLPMTATVGGRYILRGGDGEERGDIELNVAYENWGADRASDYLVVVDGGLLNSDGEAVLELKETYLRHGLRDVWSVRLGGGYSFAVGPGALLVRGGAAYDTAAAREGWERVDLDGAARFTVAGGVGYRMRRWQVDLGVGGVIEGAREVGTDCNPTTANKGCDGSGVDQPIDERTGPDPIVPTAVLTAQDESPFNAGRYSSHYLLFMLGVSTWF
ncbi:MAG: outer membrane protein transport protein [Kofleriaceae bacterium]